MRVQSAISQASENRQAQPAQNHGPDSRPVAAPIAFNTSDADRMHSPLRLQGGGKGLPWEQPSTSGASGSSSDARRTLQVQRWQLDNQRQQLESEMYNVSRSMLPTMSNVYGASPSGTTTIALGAGHGPTGDPQREATNVARLSDLTRQVNELKRQIADIDRQLH